MYFTCPVLVWLTQQIKKKSEGIAFKCKCWIFSGCFFHFQGSDIVSFFTSVGCLPNKGEQVHKTIRDMFNSNLIWTNLQYIEENFFFFPRVRISSIKTKMCRRFCWTSSIWNTSTQGTRSAALSKSGPLVSSDCTQRYTAHAAIFRLSVFGLGAMQQHDKTSKTFLTAMWSSSSTGSDPHYTGADDPLLFATVCVYVGEFDHVVINPFINLYTDSVLMKYLIVVCFIYSDHWMNWTVRNTSKLFSISMLVLLVILCCSVCTVMTRRDAICTLLFNECVLQDW